MYNLMGISAKNQEQEQAIAALTNKESDLVILYGSAGTGKTMLAIAAGLELVHNQQQYKKILVARPLTALGNDIGHLPGTKEEKLDPWMAPIYDNIDVLTNFDKDKRDWYLNTRSFEVEAVTFMRGRSISNTFMIIDECQNLSYHELKTILTRVGRGTKVIMLGDPDQSDRFKKSKPDFEKLIERLTGKPLNSIIKLERVERSRLAKMAVKYL